MWALGRKRRLDAKPFEAVRERFNGKIDLKHPSSGWR
jgi:hypothetical protein